MDKKYYAGSNYGSESYSADDFVFDLITFPLGLVQLVFLPISSKIYNIEGVNISAINKKSAERKFLEYQEEQRKKEELAKQAQLAKEEEQKKQKEREEQEKQIKAEEIDLYYNSLINEQCITDKWDAYTFGNYFYELAKNYNLKPHEVISGDSYTTRNIDSFLKSEIAENYVNYTLYHLERFSLGNIYENEQYQQRFNQIVAKHNDCYEKLK